MMISGRVLVIVGSGVLSACASQTSSVPNGAGAPSWVTTSSGLQYAVLDSGTGPVAQKGDDALIHETMRLMNGTVVFDSYAINSPVPFRVGAKQVIDGVDEAVTGMRVGGRRLLIVPPALSKREVKCESADPKECEPPGKPLFTPDDTLRYDVLLVRVTKSGS
jgi:hypothetical protein